MNILFALLDDGGGVHINGIVNSLSEVCSQAPHSVVILHFCTEPQDVDRLAPGDGVRVETIITHGRLGYGEQVKLAFELAQRLNLAAVVTLSGTLRYPLDEAPALLEALEKGAALALAVPAGEPRTIRVGSWLVSRLLNFLTCSRLTVWHSGFRAYRVDALEGIPYAKNLDDRGFNTEILIQLIIAGRTIAQVSTQNYQHSSLSIASKFRFAWGMLRAAGLSLLHQCSLFYQPQFDIGRPINAYGLKLGYRSSHSLALEAVPSGARVLDIGCGNGNFDRLLIERGCQVHGLDQHQESDVCGLDGYTKIDLDIKYHAFAVRGYEIILLLDIIEHLRYPESLLAYLRNNSGPDKPCLLVSVPNVAFFIIRLRLLFGSFQYGKLGILDLTHTRLYSEASIVSLFERNGYTVQTIEGIPAPYPKAIGLGYISRFLLACNTLLIKINRKLFSYQLFIQARPRPTLDDLRPGIPPAPPA